MTIKSILITAALAALIGAGAASAQTPAPAPAAPAATPAKPAAQTDSAKKQKAAECSAEANKQGLHGAERRKFRAKCKAGK